MKPKLRQSDTREYFLPPFGAWPNWSDMKAKKQQPVKRGVGRPRKDPAGPLRPVSVKLTPTQIKFARQLGGGKLNAGISLLIDKAMEKAK